MVVHFICRGNVLRSFIAETYLKSLKIPDITVISSGVITDMYRESDKPFFDHTTRLLASHGLGKYTKLDSEQLTQQRIDMSDVIICMNDRVLAEAKNIVALPKHTITWDVTDIGEGTRVAKTENGREVEEVIYDEIITKVDELVKTIHPLR